MALVFRQWLTEAIGDASYLVGDDCSRLCAVIDPQIDVDRSSMRRARRVSPSATLSRPTPTKTS